MGMRKRTCAIVLCLSLASYADTTDYTATWKIANGTDLNGKHYSGEVTFTPRKDGKTYAIAWNTTMGKFDGIGIFSGQPNAYFMAAAWGDAKKGFGAVAYTFASDGSLHGEWALYGTPGVGSEVISESGHPGVYKIAGTNPDGSSYKGTLALAKHGGVTDATWTTGTTAHVPGVCLPAPNANELLCAFGLGGRFGLNIYDDPGDGRAEGDFTVAGATKVGHEVIARK